MSARAARAGLVCALLAAGGASCAPRESGVTLRFWAMGREGEVVQELVRDFEAGHPGIRVIVQQIPWSAAHEKLVTAFVGRSTPDLAQLGNTWIAEFAALRAIEPLDSYVAASSAVAPAGYFPGIWDTNVLDDTLYGIPWYVDTRVIFYRRDLLARAGFDRMPGDWAGWRDAMRRVKRMVGDNRYAIFLPMNEWNVAVILGLQAGSPLLADHATRGVFHEPAFRRAYDYYIGMYREALAPPASNTDIANVYQEFERGTFAMYITGPWNLGEFRRRLAPEHQSWWATAPMPGPDGPASGLSLAGGSSLVVFRASRHKAEAWQLIEFLSRPEQQLRFARLSGDLPARREAWRDTTFTHDPNVMAFGTQLERVISTPKAPEWEQVTTLLMDQSERVIRAGVPIDTALAALDRGVDRLLEKRRWLLERNTKDKPAAAGVRP